MATYLDDLNNLVKPAGKTGGSYLDDLNNLLKPKPAPLPTSFVPNLKLSIARSDAAIAQKEADTGLLKRTILGIPRGVVDTVKGIENVSKHPIQSLRDAELKAIAEGVPALTSGKPAPTDIVNALGQAGSRLKNQYLDFNKTIGGNNGRPTAESAKAMLNDVIAFSGPNGEKPEGKGNIFEKSKLVSNDTPSKLPVPTETPAEALARSEAYAKQAHPTDAYRYNDYTGNVEQYKGENKLPKVQISDEGIPLARKSVPFMPSRAMAEPTLPELPQTGERVPKISSTETYPSGNDTTNKLDFQVNGATEKQRVQSAITNSERIKNELNVRGKDAYATGQGLSPSDIKLAERYEHGTPIDTLINQSQNPAKFEKFMQKMTDYYDFRLAADRAAGGDTGLVKNYIPHMWDLSKPADLVKFNNLAMQKGLQPYNGFRAQPRVFSTYAEGEAQGFKRANKNILGDLKNDYGTSSNVISKQVLKKGIQEAAPGKVITRGFGQTEKGKPYVNSNIPGLEGVAYHPNISDMLKGYEKLTNKDFIKMAKEEASFSGRSTLKEIPQAAKDAGFTGVVGTLYDRGTAPMKQLLLNFSGFHSINISANYAGASLTNPIKGVKGLAQSVPAFFSEKVTNKIIDGFKAKIIPGSNISVFDAGLRAGVNMDREVPAIGKARLNVFKSLSRAMFDRELHILKLNLVDQVFGNGKIIPDSSKGRAFGREINMVMGEMNNHTMNVNPNTQKWLSRVLLAPQFTETKYKMLYDAATKGGENAGHFARKAVIGKSIIIGTLATLGTFLMTGKFPNLQQLFLNYTIDPNVQTNLKNPKGQKQDIGLPKSFISEPASLIKDPVQYGMARLSPGLSDIISGVTNKDYYGNPIIDPNSKDSKTKQILKNVVVGDLPIGAQNIIKEKQGKQTGTQTAINIAGLRTHISKDDPTAIYYQQIKDAQNAIADIGGGDPNRVQKIQEIYNKLTPDQRKSLNYQELLAGISTKGVLSGEAGKMKPLYDQLQAMKANGQTDQANAIWDKLSPEDKALYKKVKIYYKKSDTTQAEKDFEPTFQEIRDMKTSGDPALEAKADQRYDELSAEEKRIYQLLKKNE